MLHNEIYISPIYARSFETPLFILFCVLIPTAIPYFCWQEDLMTSFLVMFIFRFIYTLNAALFVNSWAHAIGSRDYDGGIGPTDSEWASKASMGEGFHNYHHSFPFDYAMDTAGAYAEAARLSLIDLPDTEAKRALLWMPGFVTARDR